MDNADAVPEPLWVHRLRASRMSALRVICVIPARLADAALLPKADNRWTRRDVRLVPLGDIT